jgi:hypothetical protein
MPDTLPSELLDDEGATDDPALDESEDLTGMQDDEPLEFSFTINGSTQPTTIEQATVLELAAHFEPGLTVEKLEFWADDALIFDASEAPHQAWWLAASAEQNGMHRFVARVWTVDGRHAELDIELDLALPAPGKTMWTLGPDRLGRPARALASLGNELALLDDTGVRRVSADGDTRWQLELPFVAHAILAPSLAGTIHAIGIDDDEFVDARISPTGELVELVALGPTPDALQFVGADADAQRLAVTGTSPQGPWVGVFEHGGAPIWSSEFDGDAASRCAVALVPDGTFTAFDIDELGSPRAQLRRHDLSGALEFTHTLASGSRTLALVRDEQDGARLGTQDQHGNVIVTRVSNEGVELGHVTLYDAQTLALARWRGHEGVQVAIGGPVPSVGRVLDEAAVWGVEVEGLAQRQPLSLAVDDLGYTFALFAADREGREPLLVRLHP